MIQRQLLRVVDAVLWLLLSQQFEHLLNKCAFPSLPRLPYLLFKKRRLGVSSLVLKDIFDSCIAVCVC